MGYKPVPRKLRRVLRYHQRVFLDLMSKPPPQVKAARIQEVKDVYEHQERASSLAVLCCELSSDLMEGYI
jgi:magnesium transporter